MSSPSNKRAASGTRNFDYCRFIELDYTPMESGIMVSMRQSRGFLTPKSPERHCRRGPAPPSNRDPYGNASLGSCSNSGSCKASDASPNHRRHVKYTSCNDNHGIRPPPPEQYLTPLQQKEVCIRHLRARLKETVDKLRDKDTEIDELRTLLSRMQEDWVEEECHRVEAQLALKEARREIQQLKQVAEDVRTNLGEADTGVQQCFQDINLQNHKLETLMHNMELAQPGPAKVGPCGGGVVEAGLEVSEGLAGSSDGSPAPSLTRSSTYTKLSDQVGPEHNSAGSRCDAACFSGGGTQDSGFVCCGESGKVMSKADLLLEAAILSQETASLLNAYSRLPHSSTCEALCSSEPRVVPLHYGGIGAGASVSLSHPCLSHHHLYLHHLREQAIQTDYDHAPASAPAHGPSTSFNSDLNTIAERTFRSQACSPTSTWMSDEGEDLESVAIESAVTHPSALTDSTKFLQPVTESLSSAPPFENQQEIATLQPDEPSVTKLTDSESLPILTLAYDTRDQTDLTSEATSSSLTSSVPLPPITDTVQSSCSSPCSVQPMAGTEVEPHPQTSQPETAEDLVLDVGEVVEEDDVDESAADAENTKSGCGLPTKSYWSRHFLVDLLAVVVPVVPTVAWFCRGPHRDGQPIYHIGSLLRGCCTVALHSLRRGGLRHYSAGGGGGTGGMNI